MPIQLGGEFDFVKRKVRYVGGMIYVKLCVDVEELDMLNLKRRVQGVLQQVNGSTDDYFSLWYYEKWKNSTIGRKKVQSIDDIRRMSWARDKYNRIDKYVVLESPPPMSSRRQIRSKNLHFPTAAKLKPKTETKPSPKSIVKVKKEAINSSTRRSPRLAKISYFELEVILIGPNWAEIPSTQD